MVYCSDGGSQPIAPVTQPESRPALSSRQTPLSRFIDKRLRELAPRKTQRQIAAEAGFKSLNMVNMMKTGDTKLPLEKVPEMAKALEVDPVHLFRLTIAEFQGGAAMRAIESIFRTTVSANEAAILAHIRQLSDDADPALDARMKSVLKLALQGSSTAQPGS